MTHEGIQYVATVASVSMAIICACCGFLAIARARINRQAANNCDSCGGAGYHEIVGSDGRLTGGRYHCDCRTVYPPLEALGAPKLLTYEPTNQIDIRV